MNYQEIQKNIIFSLLLIYVWALYNFFDYNESLQYSFSKLTLYFNFLYGIIFSIGLGIILVLLRFTFFRNKKIKKLKNNFLYIFSALFNFNFVVIWVISVVMKIIDLDLGIIYLIFVSLMLSIFIFLDIYFFGYLFYQKKRL